MRTSHGDDGQRTVQVSRRVLWSVRSCLWTAGELLRSSTLVCLHLAAGWNHKRTGADISAAGTESASGPAERQGIWQVTELCEIRLKRALTSELGPP